LLTSIPTGLRTVVYLYGMEETGSAREWDFLWGRYQGALVPQEKRRLLRGLTSTRTVWLLARWGGSIMNIYIIHDLLEKHLV